MNPDEQVAIIVFNNGVHVIQPFTSDPTQVSKALETVPKLAVGTKIYDAIERGVAADRHDQLAERLDHPAL